MKKHRQASWRRSMPERERALHALAGKLFPKHGDTGLYFLDGRPRASVIVTRLSPDGSKVTVRFLGRYAVREFGANRVLARVGDTADGVYALSADTHREYAIFGLPADRAGLVVKS